MMTYFLGCILLISSFFAFSNQDPFHLKAGLHIVRETLPLYKEGKKFSLKKNPISGKINFSKYESRYYLYYFRSLGFYFESLSFKEERNFQAEEQSLKKAQKDIDKALMSPYSKGEKARIWQENILLSLIDVSIKQKKYTEAMDLSFECLEIASPSLRADILAELKVIYKALGKDTGSLKKHFISSKEETKVISESYLIKNIKPLMKNLGKFFYTNRSDLFVERMIQVYPKVKVKSRRTKNEKNFLRAVEKNFSLFSGEQMEEISRSLWRLSKPNYALFVLEKALILHKKEKAYPKLLYKKAQIYADLKKFRSAIKVLEELIKVASGTEFHEKALYKKAFLSHFYLKKNSKSLFQDYLASYPDGNYKTASTYQVLSYESSKRSKFSQKTKKDIKAFFEMNPISYYSLLLAKSYPDIYNPVIKDFFNFKTINEGNLEFQIEKNPALKGYYGSFEELKGFDLFDEAYEVLTKMSPLMKDFESQKLLVHFYKEIQRLDAQVIRSMRLFSQFPEKRSFSLLEDTFPLFEVSLVDSIIKQLKIHSLKPALVLSLIRQESAFNIKALSPVGARGLMQLMPSTAAYVAKSMKIKTYSLEEKKDNLKLGISYLNELLRDFKGNKVYALSAYNAGPHRTKKWIKKRGNMSPEAFIETIPYKETSLYVKLVMRNYLVYQMLYGERDFKKLTHLF